MLSKEHLDFCKEVKNLCLENDGSKSILISCSEDEPKTVLTSYPIPNFEVVIDIFKKIYGKNYDESEEDKAEQYKDCKNIFLHLVIR